MEPEQTSKLKASFGEYEALGEKHRQLSQKIEEMGERIGHSRKIGAFQTFHNQRKELNNLVKQREQIDAKMAVMDLARKKTDDYRNNIGKSMSYSEQVDDLSTRIESFAQKLSQLSNWHNP